MSLSLSLHSNIPWLCFDLKYPVARQCWQHCRREETRSTNLDRDSPGQNCIFFGLLLCYGVLLIPFAPNHPLLHGPQWMPEG